MKLRLSNCDLTSNNDCRLFYLRVEDSTALGR